MALKSLLFFCFDILNLELFKFQRLQVMENYIVTETWNSDS